MLQHVTLQYQQEMIVYACILHGNTPMKAGPDIIFNRFSRSVVPSMLGSPLWTHLTAHGYNVHSSDRAEENRNIEANVNNTPKPNILIKKYWKKCWCLKSVQASHSNCKMRKVIRKHKSSAWNIFLWDNKIVKKTNFRYLQIFHW